MVKRQLLRCYLQLAFFPRHCSIPLSTCQSVSASLPEEHSDQTKTFSCHSEPSAFFSWLQRQDSDLQYAPLLQFVFIQIFEADEVVLIQSAETRKKINSTACFGGSFIQKICFSTISYLIWAPLWLTKGKFEGLLGTCARDNCLWAKYLDSAVCVYLCFSILGDKSIYFDADSLEILFNSIFRAH